MIASKQIGVWAVSILNKREMDAESILLTYSAICLFVYHLELAIAHIALPRYLTMGMPFALLLLIAAFTFMGSLLREKGEMR